MSLKFAAVLSLAASLLLSPQAIAAGFLIADPAFHPGFNPGLNPVTSVPILGRPVIPGGVTPIGRPGTRPGTRPGSRPGTRPGGGLIVPIFDPGPAPQLRLC